MITVVNVKNDKRPEIIYIGRRMPGRPASPLGNPYKPGKCDGDPIQLYRHWLWAQMQTDTPARQELIRLAAINMAGHDILLGCWCAPSRCHGDVVKAAIEFLTPSFLNN